jgi:exonuclease III
MSIPLPEPLHDIPLLDLPCVLGHRPQSAVTRGETIAAPHQPLNNPAFEKAQAGAITSLLSNVRRQLSSEKRTSNIAGIRHIHPDAPMYMFWEYMRNRWSRNAGLRIDFVVLNKAAAKRLKDAGVDTAVRGREGASDHAPVWIALNSK